MENRKRGLINKNHGKQKKALDNDNEIEQLFQSIQKKPREEKLLRNKKKQRRPRAPPNAKTSMTTTTTTKKKATTSSIRYTEEGFRIYTPEQLKQDQPEYLRGECPFDCNCCF